MDLKYIPRIALLCLFTSGCYAPFQDLEKSLLENVRAGSITTDVTAKSDQSHCILIIEETATFPGGLKAWNSHLKKHIKPLSPPCDEGRVYLQFKVLASGKIDSVQVRRSLCPLADKNAVEIIKTSGPWNPANLKGKPVDSWTALQIAYRYR